jgi:hypothetical protein
MTSYIPSLATLKSAVDEIRVAYYPKNDTEKRVKLFGYFD